MPKVDTIKLKTMLSDTEWEVAKQVIRNDTKVKVSKPDSDGLTKYVWRMVVFQVSPMHQHQCMPVMADFYIPAKYGTPKYYTLLNIGNKIADAIVDCIDKSEWHGIKRWVRVL